MDREEEKNLQFIINKDDHARLRVKLYYDRMTQTKFFNHFIKAYLEDDPLIRQFMNEIASRRLGERSYKKRLKDQKEEKQTISDFALNDEEKENIFDLIERENEDI